MSPNQFPGGLGARNDSCSCPFPCTTFNYQRDDHLFGREVARYHGHYEAPWLPDITSFEVDRFRLAGVANVPCDLFSPRIEGDPLNARGSMKLHGVRCSSMLVFLHRSSMFISIVFTAIGNRFDYGTSAGINIEFLLT